MMTSRRALYPGLIVGLLRRALRSHQDLLIENLVLQEQLASGVLPTRPKKCASTRL
jgi:hypothetical protein